MQGRLKCTCQSMLRIRFFKGVSSRTFRFQHAEKYLDKTTFDERSLFSALTVLTTKLRCTMNNNFYRDLQLIEYKQRMVRIRNNESKLGVPSGKCQRGEFVYLLWNVPIQIFAIYIFFHNFRGLKWIPL